MKGLSDPAPIAGAKLVPSVGNGGATPARSTIVGATSTIETRSSSTAACAHGEYTASGIRTHASYGHVFPSQRCSPNE